ncbi:Ig-like domain-containing protein [Peribacillus sp. NPDC097224]|uniref:Ig-like domain-containing protein n=1 Tax=Peribacillus sp. NPDC097224 TaxID=3364399 RepID=UPI00380608EA
MKKSFVFILALVFSLFSLNLGAVGAATVSVEKGPGLKSPFERVHNQSYKKMASEYLIEKEPNNTIKKSNSISLKQFGLGIFNKAKDVDYYKIKVKHYGFLYVVAATEFNSSLDFSLYNAKNKAVSLESSNRVDQADTQLYSVSPGTYYIKVKDTGSLKSQEEYAVGATMSGPTIKKVGDKDTKISGEAEPNTTVYVKVNNKVVNKKGTKIKANGKYSVTIGKQKAGTKVSVWSTGTVGGKEYQTTPVKTTVKDVTAPKTLTVSAVTSSSKSVSGKTEAKATVQVKVGSKVLGKATADKNGKYKVTMKKQKKKTKLSVVATDKAGNAKTVKVTVK